MDNAGNNLQRSNNSEEPIPFDVNADEPSRPEATPAGAPPGVSRAPLSLGGAAGAPAAPPAQTPRPATPTPAPVQAPKPAAPAVGAASATKPPAPTVAPVPAPRPPVIKPVQPKPAVSVGPVDRIIACKTFFTKLHPGAIKFLEEQITGWLKENPTIVIKRTNVIMGEVQEKKTEPNIVIVVWY